MRKALLFLVVVVAVGAFFLFWQSASATIGTLDILKGSAQIMDGGKTIDAKTGASLSATATIIVPAGSRVSVLLKDGTVFRLEENTEVSVKILTYKGAKLDQAVTELKKGKIWWNTKPLNPGGKVQVETPGLVATVRGTSFNVSYTGSSSSLYVSRHSVVATDKDDPNLAETVDEGDILKLENDNPKDGFDKGSEPLPQDEKGDWIIFNESEDAALAAANGETGSSDSSSSLHSSSSSKSSASSKSSKATTGTTGTTTPDLTASSTASATMSSKASSTPSVASTASQGTTGTAGKTVTKVVLTGGKDSMAVGDRMPLYVTVFYDDNSKETTHNVSWLVQPATAGRVDAAGIFSAKEQATASITATFGTTESNTLVITISGAQSSSAVSSVATKTLLRLAVGCLKNSPRTSPPLYSAACKAVGYYSDQTTADVTDQVQWSAKGTSEGTIDGKGYYQAYSQGTDTITAVSGDLSGSTTITNP